MPTDIAGLVKDISKKRLLGCSKFSCWSAPKNNFDISAGIRYEHFTRHIKSSDTLSGVVQYLDHHMDHQNYTWFGELNKKLPQKKQSIFYRYRQLLFKTRSGRDNHTATQSFHNSGTQL